MAKIKIRNKVEVPLPYPPSGEVRTIPQPKKISLDLSPFYYLRLEPLVKVGDVVRKGEPLVRDKKFPVRQFVSPCFGKVEEIKRGSKRLLSSIVLENHLEGEEIFPYEIKEIDQPDKLIEIMLMHGLGAHICKRPFGTLATTQIPRSIFINATRADLYTPPVSLQIKNWENFFEHGLSLLQGISPDNVHLLVGEEEEPYLHGGKNCHTHTIIGSKVSPASLAISYLDPIQSIHDVIWEIDVVGVIALGRLFLEGVYHTDRIIGIGGQKELSGFYAVHNGWQVEHLLKENVEAKIIIGSPFTGRLSSVEGFLGLNEYAISLLPEEKEREWLYFFKLGLKKFTLSRAYFSKFSQKNEYSWTTSQNGEERAFIDPMIYQKAISLHIPVAYLIKALLVEDFEQAVDLGFLEIVPADLALSTFICPSKIDIMGIFDRSAKRYAQEQLSLV